MPMCSVAPPEPSRDVLRDGNLFPEALDELFSLNDTRERESINHSKSISSKSTRGSSIRKGNIT